MTNVATRILGLDPGLRRTGWGVIVAEGSRLRWVAHGVVAPPEGAPPDETRPEGAREEAPREEAPREGAPRDDGEAVR